MLFSGMCLLKISWEFIKNSTAERSSPKKPLLTVHTFSFWKCKCNWRNICKWFYCDFLNTLSNALAAWVRVLHLWILLVQIQLHDSGYLLLELFLHSFHIFMEITTHSLNYCLCCRYAEMLAISKVKEFILQNLNWKYYKDTMRSTWLSCLLDYFSFFLP